MSLPQQLTPFGHALAGALGAVFSNSVVYPLDTAKTRIQAAPSTRAAEGTKRDHSMIKMLKRIYDEEGIGGYYKGYFASTLNTFSQQYAYFFFYSLVRGSYIKRLAARAKSTQLSTAAELLLSALAGALAQIFTIPVSVIATRQQVGRKSVSAADDSFLGVAREIVREDGPTGLWLGLQPGLVLTVNPAITYGVFARIRPARALSPLESLALGATSKTLATVITYPYIMAKTRVQARSDTLPGAARGARAPGALDILTRVLRNEGPLGWYQGMGAQITKAVLSQALLFASKDQFERYALALLVASARVRARGAAPVVGKV